MKEDRKFEDILKENEESINASTSELHNQWIEFLRKEVRENCNENGAYEIYWDYNDTIEPQTIIDAIERAETNNTTIESEILDEISEYNVDYDENLLDEIRNNIPEELEEYAEERDIFEDLYDECGYTGLDMNIEELLDRVNLKVNILYATPEEQNRDMSSIIVSYGSYKAPEFENLDETDLDNGMTYLIHQQGHSVKEYYDCLMKNPGGFSMEHESTFIESCVDDCVNNSSEAMSVMTFCGTVPASEIDKLIGLKNTKGKYIKLDKGAYGGTFNPWAGAGGFEISLEKPVVIPTDYIYDIQIEGGKNSSGYTVDEVFGLVGECWDTIIEEGSAPTLYEEDMKEVVEYARQFADKDDEELSESKATKVEEDKSELTIKWQEVEYFDDMSGNSKAVYGELSDGTYYLYMPSDFSNVELYSKSPKELIDNIIKSIEDDFNEELNIKAFEEFEPYKIGILEDEELAEEIMEV